MSSTVRLLGTLLASVVTLVGCSGSTIPAHKMTASIAVDGATTSSVLAFPDHDASALHESGDSTCSWNTGNCGFDAKTYATITGNAPISAAWIITIGGDPANLTYYVTLNQPGFPGGSCVVDISIGKPVTCDRAAPGTLLTLSPD